MRFSIAIPQFDFDGFDAAGLRVYLARAEELGFEGGWVLEQIIGEAPLLAPLELLAYCAACTERLRLGVAVLVSSLHDPLQLASAVTAVDRLSRHVRTACRLQRGVPARLSAGPCPHAIRDRLAVADDRRESTLRSAPGRPVWA